MIAFSLTNYFEAANQLVILISQPKNEIIVFVLKKKQKYLIPLEDLQIQYFAL